MIFLDFVTRQALNANLLLATSPHPSSILYDILAGAMDQPASTSNDLSRTHPIPSTMDSPNSDALNGQKRAREDRNSRGRGSSKSRGSRGGRDKRGDMGRGEWRYEVDIAPMVPYPLTNEVEIG